jgi:hypothetical protein
MGFLGWGAEVRVRSGVLQQGWLFGNTYELAVAGGFGVGSPGVEGDAPYQHGSRQRRNALNRTGGR